MPSAEAAACHLVWAEYERIDWERIYAGEDFVTNWHTSLGSCPDLL